MSTIDQNFMQNLDQGEQQAFERVKKLCYSSINFYTKNRETTEELASIALDKVVDTIHGYNPTKGNGSIEANFKKWVKKIAYNTYLDYRERKKREVTFTELAAALGLDAADRDVIESGSESLDKVLSLEAYNRYPSRDNPLWNIAVKEVLDVMNGVEDGRKRIALLLKFVYGFTTIEIADVMKENFDSIQSVIHRATKELRARFEEKGIDANYLDPGSWKEKTATG